MPLPVHQLLNRCLSAETLTEYTPAGFLERVYIDTTALESTLDKAAVGGAMADRLGHAFAFAYQCALIHLVGDDIRAALAVTESAGNHPRHIKTTAESTDEGWVLRGEKSFVTLADHVDEVLVAVSTGWEGGVPGAGRNQLRLVRVPLHSDGVAVTMLPSTPFTPEIHHGALSLNDVVVGHSAMYPGDGWTQYIKPFRTVEDAHVGVATAGMLLRRVPASVLPELAVATASFASLATADMTRPETHLIVDGALNAVKQVSKQGLPHAEAAWLTRFRRDQTLLSVAGGARRLRLAAALRSLSVPE